MALPTPPAFSDPIPNPSPTIPNVAEEYLVKGPYWDMKVTGGLSVTSGGALQVTGASEPGPGADTAEITASTGHLTLGNGLGVVEGNIIQFGAGTGTIPYSIYTNQGPLVLGNSFYVNPSTGNLELD